jgi:tetratricopeptide (TPR) repeat protein
MRSPAIVMTPAGSKPGRNAPCPCGSGKRYKHCCGAERTAVPGRAPPPPNALARPQGLDGLVMLINEERLREAEEGALRLLKERPGTGMVWKVLSVALVRQGKNALPALRKTAELMPRDAEAHANLGSALLAAGQSADGLASLRRALELRPNDVDSLVEAADASLALGRSEEALDLYRRALEIDPRAARAHNNLGNAFAALGRCEDAVKCYRRALADKPQDALVLSNLADALRQLGQLEEAVTCSERAIALHPALSRAHTVLGVCLGGLGRRERAVASLRQALGLDPRSVEALLNLANVLRELGQRRESLALYRQAVELDPKRAESHCGLGNALFELRRLEEAAESHRRALALRPEYTSAQVGLAAALRVQRRAEEAEAICRAALSAAPNDVEALVLLGELRGDLGHFAESGELLERAIQLDPRCVSAYCGIAAHRGMTSEDGAWLSGAQGLLVEPLPLGQTIALRYALGKYCDDVGRYDDAFGHYRQANELTKRYGSRYDGDKLVRRIDALVEHFDTALIGGLSGPVLQSGEELSSRDERASGRSVFIIGMPRSGTSLVEQILASHPRAYGAGELRFWGEAFATLEKTGLEMRAARALVPQFARDYLGRLATAPQDALRVIDKMPANFLYAGLIHAAFPRARIIHMQRHPIDTCLSIYFQNFFGVSPYASDLAALAHYYAQYVRITDHWRAVLPAASLLEVPYEALVTDPEGWTRRMLSFIGLPWDPQCLEFHRTERVVITASRWQVRQKIHGASVGRWKHYEKHIGPLLPLTGPAAPSRAAAGAEPESAASAGPESAASAGPEPESARERS